MATFSRSRPIIAPFLLLFLAALPYLAAMGAAAAGPATMLKAHFADRAERLQHEIATGSKPGRLSAAGWMKLGDKAMALKSVGTAARAYARATQAAGADSTSWLKLASALAAYSAQGLPEAVAKLLPPWLKKDNAGAAAYVALQKGTTPGDRAHAYALIGRHLERRQKWRPALESYRASLAARHDPEVAKRYADLRSRKGFRIVDHKVNADSATPQVCIHFSETLPKRDVDLTKFLLVDGKDPVAVTPKGRQLCIDGFSHGGSHEITIRAGLPSQRYESLAKATTLKVYVRDRAAYLRFSGRRYVLPRTGQAGIPLTSVNVSSAHITVYRIGDRNVTDTVLGYDFARQIGSWTAEKIRARKGEQVWSGTLAIKRKLNKEVVTAFPVRKALKDMKPGVYVMVARSDDTEGEDWHPLATQWFIVSDIGLTTYSGDDGIHVFARSLETARPLADVGVRLIARNNEILQEATTDARGYVRFAPGLARGEGGMAPALVVAQGAQAGYAVLSLKDPGFDLSDRGVAGGAPAGPVNALLYTERGIYRPGADVHVTALLRDQRARALPGLPLTLVLVRPDGVEQSRNLLKDQGLGGRTHKITLLPSAMTGTWTLEAYVNNKADPVASARFLVEEFIPDRLQMQLTPAQAQIKPGAQARVTLAGSYLYGAPASNLRLEGEVVITPRRQGLEGFDGYLFGDADERVTPERQSLEALPRTDKDGRASLAFALPPLPQSTQPLVAKLAVRLLEPSGRGIERNLELAIAPQKPLIGIKPLFAGDTLREGTEAAFELIAVGPDGRPMALPGLRWELSRLETRYQWYRYDGRWDYEKVTSSKVVAGGRIDLASTGPVRLRAPVEWGRYRLEVFSETSTGPFARFNFKAGWYSAASDADTPDMLEMALDRQDYAAGDVAQLRVRARHAGRLQLAVMGTGLLAVRNVEVQKGDNSIPLTVEAGWSPGAYIVATLYRPMAVASKRMPSRAIGVEWLGVDRAARTLKLAIKAPERIRPMEELSVPVELSGLAPGEEAYVVAAAVDVGILNLTRYKTPAPEEVFYGKRKLAMEIRDLYGRLIDGMQGTAGRIRSGGDGGLEVSGSPPVEKPLALFSGLRKVGADGRLTLSFDIPAFTGTVRVMAVAWSRTRTGHGQADVFVRDPLVLSGTTPRFMALGDTSHLHLSLNNVEGPEGFYTLKVESGTGLISQPAGPLTYRMHFAKAQRKSLMIPIKATGLGLGWLSVHITGPEGHIRLARRFEVPVQPAFPAISRRSVQSIASAGSLVLSSDIFTGLVPGSARVTIATGAGMAAEAPALLAALDRYPYRCSEQITSRTLPFLYLSAMAEKTGLAGAEGKKTIRARVARAIRRLLSRQDSEGAFGLWQPGGEDLWLNAYVTDFLTRAREQGHAVPATALQQALNLLHNKVGYASDFKKGGEGIAYALYVLARNKRARIGDLRYYADVKIEAFSTPLARAHIAASLALYGDQERARKVFAIALDGLRKAAGTGSQPASYASYQGNLYGSWLRDQAAIVTLVSESRVPGLTIADIERALGDRTARDFANTQEKAWMLMAVHALMEEARDHLLEVNGKLHQGALTQTLSDSEIAALGTQGLQLVNRGKQPIRMVLVTTGTPQVAEPAAAKGFSLTRKFYTLDGQEVSDFSKLPQNSRLMVVLRALQTIGKPGEVVVVDRLPAGFEIENPRLIASAANNNFDWLPSGISPRHSEFRKDRFVAAFRLDGSETQAMTMAYMVRAVAPGSYVLPPATIEDMYRPELFARTASGRVNVLATGAK